MSLILKPMSLAEYIFWSARSRTEYAADKMKANGYTEEEARKISENDFNRLLPDGLTSKDNYLFSAWSDDAAGRNSLYASGGASTDASGSSARASDRPSPHGSAPSTSTSESAARVGFIWFCVRGAENNRKAFVADVIIEENFRGQGLGRQMMLALETEVRKLGLNHIGLHVFAFNTPAVNLYKSLGFEITDLSMEKKLT
jgi:ribosomal protein S18 acetylase RimI-like enzyme